MANHPNRSRKRKQPAHAGASEHRTRQQAEDSPEYFAGWGDGARDRRDGNPEGTTCRHHSGEDHGFGVWHDYEIGYHDGFRDLWPAGEYTPPSKGVTYPR